MRAGLSLAFKGRVGWGWCSAVLVRSTASSFRRSPLHLSISPSRRKVPNFVVPAKASHFVILAKASHLVIPAKAGIQLLAFAFDLL